jgi:hypothetical protein
VKEATDRATFLAQNIVKTRNALMLLRQTHPSPRLTIPLADEKLADQVTEMQRLSDEVQTLKQKIKSEKGKMKDTAGELENLRSEAAEVEKMAKFAQVEEDDGRILPLYDWGVECFPSPQPFIYLISSCLFQVYCLASATWLNHQLGRIPLRVGK